MFGVGFVGLVFWRLDVDFGAGLCGISGICAWLGRLPGCFGLVLCWCNAVVGVLIWAVGCWCFARLRGCWFGVLDGVVGCDLWLDV